jgi:16S rRNA (guanine527-N7)-methyltransferase
MDRGRPTTTCDPSRRRERRRAGPNRTQDRRRALDRQREPLPTRVDATPPLPAAYHRALEAALHELGVELGSAQRSAIDGHVRLLLAWNQSINLTAIRDPEAIAVGHVIDSLTALPELRERGLRRFVDLGSGGGYPGLPVAAALPADGALLVDSITKKVRFLDAAAAAVGMAGTIATFTGRAEQLAGDLEHRERWPAVLARAVAALPELVELSFPLLAQGGVLIAWKRADVSAEVTAATRATDALGGGTVQTTDVAVRGLTGHRLVIVTKTGPTHERFPRDPTMRRRSPW